MKNTKHGFIALFFTLNISSILLVYMAVGSGSVFEYVYTREGFYTHRKRIEADLQCADLAIDMLIRSGYMENPHSCSITSIAITHMNLDTFSFSFMSNSIPITGILKNGLIFSL